MPAPTELTIDELGRQTGELLPARAALGLINIANITAVNIAIAVNAASFGSKAIAVANQGIAVTQL